ncbi:MAG: DUF4416 family protein [Acidobacteria bacterium]|nr:DUF4416 family protein [Acidobacteriota bacterium]
MGQIRSVPPVKLFCGVLYADGFPWAAVLERLTSACGPVDRLSEPLPFNFTDYYRDDMGPVVWRRFAAFAGLAPPGGLPALKVTTNRLEAELAADEATGLRRPVNLDPGYLEQAKIVLASTKNFAHRVYLAEGIWGEVTLQWRNRRWEALPWTFPDFRSPAYQAFFTELRDAYRRELTQAQP